MIISRQELIRLPELSADEAFVIMTGLPGSGKSHIASELERDAGYKRFSLEQEYFLARDGDDLWENLFVHVLKAARNENRIVVDTPAIYRRQRRTLAGIAGESSLPVIRIFMKTDVRTCQARVRRRELLGSADPIYEVIEPMHGVLSSSENAPNPNEGPWLVLVPIQNEIDRYELTTM